MMDAENFGLVDKFHSMKLEWNSHEELLALMKMTANGWHRLVNPIQDFIVDHTPPLLRVGRRVNEFWKEFARVEKLPQYVPLSSEQC